MGSVCAEQFFNVVLLREPVDRIVSMWNFMRQYRSADTVGRWPTSLEARVALSHVASDNFYTRMLLGRHGWALPLHGVNSSHYKEVCRTFTRARELRRPRACETSQSEGEDRRDSTEPHAITGAHPHRSQAVRRLEAFDLVLILETVNECKAAVRMALGWSESTLPRINVAPHTTASSDRTALHAQNAWDVTLFRVARSIAADSCAAFDRVARDPDVGADVAAYRAARRASCMQAPERTKKM